MQKQNFWPGQWGVTQCLELCWWLVRVHLWPPGGSAEPEAEETGPQTEGRSRAQQLSRATPGLSPLPEGVCLVSWLCFCVGFCFSLLKIYWLGFQSIFFFRKFILSLSSKLLFYSPLLSSLSLSIMSHSQPHKTAFLFLCSPGKWADSNLDLKSQSLLFTLLWLIVLCKVSPNSDFTEWCNAVWEVGFQRRVKSQLCPRQFWNHEEVHPISCLSNSKFQFIYL